MKALIYDIDKYNTILCKGSNNNVEIAWDGVGEWFYIVSENYTEEVTDEAVYN